MASERYDLHVHTTASDGALRPREIVALAVDRGLAGVAITDHDTVAGVAEAVATGHMLGVDVIPGIEVSCFSEHAGTVHLLGYLVDPTSPPLGAMIDRLAATRMERAVEMVQAINSLTGVLTIEHVLEESGGGPPGRPHIARAMVRVGILAEAREAFTGDWLAPGGRAWVRRNGIDVREAIATIHAAGGVAVFAHPGSRSGGTVREPAVRDAAAHGLDGIEVDHPDHTEDAMRRCAALATELDLVGTSGSDDHGHGVEGSRLGARTVPRRVVDELRARAAARASG